MSNVETIAKNEARTPPPALSWRYVVRERLIAELHIRAHAWRNQEYVARVVEGDEAKAGQCRACAEAFEQFARDLDDPRQSLGAKVGA